jgi:hypothetical protein
MKTTLMAAAAAVLALAVAAAHGQTAQSNATYV